MKGNFKTILNESRDIVREKTSENTRNRAYEKRREVDRCNQLLIERLPVFSNQGYILFNSS